MTSLADIIQRGQQLNTRGRPIAEGIATAGQAFGANLAKRFEDEAAQDRARKQREQAAMAAAAEAGLTDIFGSEEERAKIQAELDEILGEQKESEDFLADVERADELRQRLAEGKYVTRWQEKFIQDVDRELGREGNELPKRTFWERLDYAIHRRPFRDPERVELMTSPESKQHAVDMNETRLGWLRGREDEIKQKLASQPKLISEMNDEELAAILGTSKKALRDAEIQLMMDQARAKAEAEAQKAAEEARKEAEEAARKKFEYTEQVANKYRDDFKEDFTYINALNTILDVTAGKTELQDHESEIVRGQLGLLLDPQARKKLQDMRSGNVLERIQQFFDALAFGKAIAGETLIDLVESVKSVGSALDARINAQLAEIEKGLNEKYVDKEAFRLLIGYRGLQIPQTQSSGEPQQKNTNARSSAPANKKSEPLTSVGGEPINPEDVSDTDPEQVEFGGL